MLILACNMIFFSEYYLAASSAVLATPFRPDLNVQHETESVSKCLYQIAGSSEEKFGGYCSLDVETREQAMANPGYPRTTAT